MNFLFALHKCLDKLLHALGIFALKLSSAQMHYMSFDKQSEKMVFALQLELFLQ